MRFEGGNAPASAEVCPYGAAKMRQAQTRATKGGQANPVGDAAAASAAASGAKTRKGMDATGEGEKGEVKRRRRRMGLMEVLRRESEMSEGRGVGQASGANKCGNSANRVTNHANGAGSGETKPGSGPEAEVEVKRGRRRAAGIDVVRLWAEIEEQMVPNLRLKLFDRALYFHLVRVTRLKGKRMLVTSMPKLAADAALCKSVVKKGLWRLERHGAVRILYRNYHGHRVEVRLPQEIPGCRRHMRAAGRTEAAEDCYHSPKRRQIIFERDGHRCFYCLRNLGKYRVVDHVVPQSQKGGDDYWNLVACCPACNFAKGELSAEDLLRKLVRQEVLSRREFNARIEALRLFRQKKLRPETDETKVEMLKG